MIQSQKKTRKPIDPHWYQIRVEECVGCGKGNEIRTRHYGVKPDYHLRRSFTQRLCHNCMY